MKERASRVTRVIASEAAVDAVRSRGGRLWVWTRSSRCCSGTVRLEVGTESRAGREFRLVASEPFELRLATAQQAPEEIHIELSRRGRLDAYWNGCAWVI
jgi:hypothetical protein